MKVRMLFETGYEEVEALTVVDLLRRAKVDCLMVAADDQDTVTGSHGITVKMDEKISELADDADMIVLPGGMPPYAQKNWKFRGNSCLNRLPIKSLR